MNVGDYVRTEYGIALIKSIREDRIIINLKTNEKYIELEYELDTCIIPDDEGTSYFCGKENIIKSSPNIIDLIEVGDYVNGSEVCKIYDNKHLDNPEKEVFCMGKDGFEGELIYTNNSIKSIVTKEQFEWMQYKVGE